MPMNKKRRKIEALPVPKRAGHNPFFQPGPAADQEMAGDKDDGRGVAGGKSQRNKS